MSGRILREGTFAIRTIGHVPDDETTGQLIAPLYGCGIGAIDGTAHV